MIRSTLPTKRKIFAKIGCCERTGRTFASTVARQTRSNLANRAMRRMNADVIMEQLEEITPDRRRFIDTTAMAKACFLPLSPGARRVARCFAEIQGVPRAR